MSTALTQLSGDVASFYNITQDEAYTKLKSVFTGETETLKDLGVVMTENALNSYAMAKGIGKSVSKMTEQQKVALRYQFVLEKLSGATGDFVRTQDSWANQTRILKLQLESLKATIGQGLINVLTPALKMLNAFLEKLKSVANSFKSFTESVFGKSSSTGTGSGQKGYADAAGELAGSLEDVSDSAEDAEKALENYLSPLDEINKYSSGKDNDLLSGLEDIDFGNLDGLNVEVAVTPEIDDSGIADKIKSVLQRLFDPIKKAWDKEGQFVIDSWKYALDEIGKLLKDIGRDFLKVWNQPKTVAMLEDMLHIIGDIGLIVGTIAAKLREAWNYNDTGLHILENIRDIFAAIFHNIREAADATVEWAKTLDFRPLLTSIEHLTGSLVRFADFLSGTLADFWTEFILPLTSWTLLEAGLPRLINILASFFDSVNWEGLRAALKNLYQALEPYAEKIGTGLIDFIEYIKNEGVAFFNYLPGAIQNLADALKSGDLPRAFEQLGEMCGEAVRHAFNIIREAIESIPWGDIGVWIASFINGIGWGGVTEAIFGSVSSAINAAIDFLYNFVNTLEWSNVGRAIGENLQKAWDAIDWRKAGDAIGTGLKGVLDFLLSLVQEMDWAKIGRDIGNLIGSIPWGEILSEAFEIIWQVVSGLISGLLDTKSGKIILAIATGITAIKGLFEAADFALTVTQWASGGVSKFSILSEGAKLLQSGLSTIISGIASLFSPTGLLIAAIAAAVVLIVTHWDEIKEAASALKDWIGEKWSEIKASTAEKWSEIKAGLSETWENIKSDAREKFENLKANLAETWENIRANAKEVWDNIRANLSETFENIRADAKEKWDSIRENLHETWDNIKEKARETWDNIKDKFREAADDMRGKADELREKFNELKDRTGDAFGSMQDKIGSAVENMRGKIDSFKDKIKEAISAVKDFFASGFEKISSTVGGFFGGGSGRSAGFSSYSLPSPYATNPALVKAAQVPIPALAKGTVIPPNREFVALLGDQKSGTNIEASLDTIKQAQKEGILEVFSQLGLTGGSIGKGNTYNVKAMADRRVLFEIMIEEGKLQQMSTGNNPFMLGMT